jgi:hypothetical protein
LLDGYAALPSRRGQSGVKLMMMMDMTGNSVAMIGMGAIWLLILAFLVLGIASFIKYLRS